jgi:hypothetical protein
MALIILISKSGSAWASGQLRANLFFASMMREQLFEIKHEDAIKNLTHVLSKAYTLALCMARSNLVTQFL